MKLISKSKYLIGLQCPLHLWTTFHEPDKLPEVDVETQKRFDEGHEVGEMAKKLFPGGIDLPVDDFLGNIQLTKASLQEGKPLFEPGFLTEDKLFSRGDILVPNGDSWDIIEVKSGTKVKDINVHDVSFQKHVYEKCGLKIKKCYLMHINNEYIRKGEIEAKKLLVKEDITSKVDEIYSKVPERISEMKGIIDDPIKPSNKIGVHCSNPYDCPLVDDCWSFLPSNHVFQLYRGKSKAFKLVENGIYSLKDIPFEFKLNDKQGIQKDCDASGSVYVDKSRLKHFLKTITYPAYYLDFETFQTAIPKFSGSKPYQQIPFQYSLHVVSSFGVEPEHYSFLYSGKGDPREEFASSLKKVLGSSGTIVVYNQTFEISRLRELGLFLPSYSSWVEGIVSRVVDLWVPFRNFSYYNPIQKGSASIKKVLPALTGKDYSHLGISDGVSASIEFYNMAYKSGKDVREDLLKYCCLDTLSMVWIVEKLGGLV
ncbi:DUF2779 domain-containing protein [archaeon]|nr:DUF2779 domain-containing protein [archaeon]